mmetsp:Transcript_29004/g.47677  ORF Transcript_29004/g.47677 Transcript_29004/m.47677 type:complete len:255 (-) Transcript_29004:667-1431(-)
MAITEHASTAVHSSSSPAASNNNSSLQQLAGHSRQTAGRQRLPRPPSFSWKKTGANGAPCPRSQLAQPLARQSGTSTPPHAVQGPPPPPPPLSSRPYTPATRGAAALREPAAGPPSSSSSSPAVEGVVDGAGDGLHERGGERDVRQPGEEAAGGHARQLLHAALAVLVGEQLHQWDLLAGLGGLLDLRDGHVQGQRAHGAGGAAQQARRDLLRAGELVVRVAPLVDHILGHHAEEKAGGPVGHALGAEDRGALH